MKAEIRDDGRLHITCCGVMEKLALKHLLGDSHTTDKIVIDIEPDGKDENAESLLNQLHFECGLAHMCQMGE